MDYYDPVDLNERRSVAGDCNFALDYEVPTFVDDMDDAVNKAFAAWPTRLYLIGIDGRVVYAGGMGPFNFKPAEFKAEIEIYLGSI